MFRRQRVHFLLLFWTRKAVFLLNAETSLLFWMHNGFALTELSGYIIEEDNLAGSRMEKMSSARQRAETEIKCFVSHENTF